MIRLSDPLASYLAHKSDIDMAVDRVLQSGQYLLGPETEAFEREFASYLGVRHAVTVASGTESLHAALVAAGIGAGHEVITVSFTAIATIAAIQLSGALPVLIDVDPASLTMNPDLLEQAITSRTRGIIPVHLFGHPCEMSVICDVAEKHDLVVVEDCAQAHGAAIGHRKVGTFGVASSFSFYPTKNLSALGDAGIVATNDDKIAERVTSLRQYGWDEHRVSRIPGWNARMDEIQAAVLRAKLPFLEQDNLRRIRLAGLYRSGLEDLGFSVPRTGIEEKNVFHQYVVRTTDRDFIHKALMEEGIQTGVHYPLAAHQHPAFTNVVRAGSPLVESEKACREVLSLPVYPELPDSSIGTILDAIRHYYNKGLPHVRS